MGESGTNAENQHAENQHAENQHAENQPPENQSPDSGGSTPDTSGASPSGTSGNRRDLAIVGVLWLVLTVLGEIVAASADLHPLGTSREARISDDAFDLLLYLAVPVFVFVLVAGGYALIRHRAGRGETPGSLDTAADGPPIRDNRTFTVTWLVVSTALAVLVIITPGFTGLDELRAEPDADLVIDVRGERWNWTFTYPETGRETQGTLVVPVDTRVKFRVTSTDVIHSFWVPAFRIKIDAVPGRVTETMVTAEEIGTFGDDERMRVQCAELCGIGHARMWTEVVVMSQADFADWMGM